MSRGRCRQGWARALLFALLAAACAPPPVTASVPIAAASPPVAAPPASTEPSAPASSGLQLPYYSTIALHVDGSLRSYELELTVSAPDGPFGELTRRGLAGRVHSQRLRVRLPETYPLPSEPPEPYARACSHLIDCDDPSFAATDFGALGTEPSPLALTDFTHRFITRKSLTRAFDIASRVLIRREGDCTEHAVLTTALARRYDYFARVILGFALLRQAGSPPALVGHAWSELHDGARWHLADAALPSSVLTAQKPRVTVDYLPISVVEREDAGFRLALLGTLDGSLVRSATVGPPATVETPANAPARGPAAP